MEKQKYIVGVDPGLEGAFAYLRADGFLFILDMPTKKITLASGKKRIAIDPARLAERFDRHDIHFAMIEEQFVHPRQKGALQTGMGYGMIIGVIAANYHKYETVRPQDWKKAMGVTQDKKLTQAKASLLMPGAAHLWANAGQDGRTEAALIALYTAEKLGIEIPPVRTT